MGCSRQTLAYCDFLLLQVFSGAAPFNNSLPAAAALAIIGGGRLSRPVHQHLINQSRALTQRYWDQSPHSRPEVSEVFGVLCGWYALILVIIRASISVFSVPGDLAPVD